jgi:hypothetical protein
MFLYELFPFNVDKCFMQSSMKIKKNILQQLVNFLLAIKLSSYFLQCWNFLQLVRILFSTAHFAHLKGNNFYQKYIILETNQKYTKDPLQ